MNLNESRTLIDQIITMPTSAAALSYVQRHHPSLFDPSFSQALLQMTREENEQHGRSWRHKALIRLNEYISAVVRNRLLDAAPGLAANALPDLIVVGEESPPQEELDDELEEETARRRAREQWWQTLAPRFSTTESVVPAEDSELLDYHVRSSLIASIDNRLLSVSMALSQSRASEEALAILEVVVRDCDRLLNASPSQSDQATLSRLWSKRADALKYIAQTYDVLGETHKAQRAYVQAAEALQEIGRPEEAIRCRVNIVAMTFNHGKLPQKIEAIAQLRQILMEIPEDQGYAEHLMTLGEMYSALGEDVEADQALDRVEKLLEALKAGNPTGTDIAEALDSTLRAVSSKKADPSSGVKNLIGDKMQLRNLYRRLYMLRQQIYRGRGDAASEAIYHKLMEQQEARERLDGTIAQGNQINTEFSEQMIQRLGSLLELMDNPMEDT